MDPASYEAFDLHRMFLGDLPWTFTLEIVVRTVLIYGYALLLVRFLRKRVAGQLSLIEFLVVVALGSAVGDPMLYPDVPLVHAAVVITVVVLLNRGLTYSINNVERVETFIEGTPVALVEDGRIVLEGLDETQLSLEKLSEQLRLQGLTHLGEVRRAYMEQAGKLSVYCYAPAEQRPGLRLVPPWDLEPPAFLEQGTTLEADALLACARCGLPEPLQAGVTLSACPRCQSDEWTDAVCA